MATATVPSLRVTFDDGSAREGSRGNRFDAAATFALEGTAYHVPPTARPLVSPGSMPSEQVQRIRQPTACRLRPFGRPRTTKPWVPPCRHSCRVGRANRPLRETGPETGQLHRPRDILREPVDSHAVFVHDEIAEFRIVMHRKPGRTCGFRAGRAVSVHHRLLAVRRRRASGSAHAVPLSLAGLARHIGGQPSASCRLPSVRVILPTSAGPVPTAAVTLPTWTRGRTFAQSPSQFDFGGPAASWPNR